MTTGPEQAQERARTPIEWRIAVAEDVRRSVEALCQSQRTLEEVVRWGLSLSPPRLVLDVVVQDEYTHDVVVGHPSGVYLVYDTT